MCCAVTVRPWQLSHHRIYLQSVDCKVQVGIVYHSLGIPIGSMQTKPLEARMLAREETTELHLSKLQKCRCQPEESEMLTATQRFWSTYKFGLVGRCSEGILWQPPRKCWKVDWADSRMPYGSPKQLARARMRLGQVPRHFSNVQQPESVGPWRRKRSPELQNPAPTRSWV